MSGNQKLKDFLKNYSFEDLAYAFFALNLWLPNSASPIKIQNLYVVLESIFPTLAKDRMIETYKDFEEFFKRLSEVLPEFPMMEDYVPEQDWGEIKYYLRKKLFKIFYGGDLSNPYDYIYSFEVIYKGFEDFYMEKVSRSPITELEFCLMLQDEMISGIDRSTQDEKEITQGEFSIPSENFWLAVCGFLDNFDAERSYSPDLVALYTKDLASEPVPKLPSEGTFQQRAHDGQNCPYFFVKWNGRTFPVLPRKYFAVLMDKWAAIFNDLYTTIEKEVSHHETKIGLELYGFIRARTNEDEVFSFATAVDKDLKPHETIFTTVFRSKDRLVLIHVIPPPSRTRDQDKIIKGLVPELKKADELFAALPTRVGLMAEKQIMQFQTSKDIDAVLRPLILTVIPHINTELGMIAQPKDLVGEIIGLDQLLGIMDEIEDLDDIADFFDYVDSARGAYGLMPFTSHLDRFGSYKDSSGVLIEGASMPDMVMLDPHWGSSYRYRSLSEFWTNYPDDNFFGHPRSWTILEKGLKRGNVILGSKTFRGLVHYQQVGLASVFINSPIHALRLEQGKLVDLMMGCIADSFKLYAELLKELSFATGERKVHILLFPASLVKEDEDFKHLRHLIPNEEIWKMDLTRLRSRDYGLRIVFDDEKAMELFRDAQDRTAQIDLIAAVLDQVEELYPSDTYEEVKKKLSEEKPLKNRFRIFAAKRQVAFPEIAGHAVPENKEFKLTNKKVAEIALANGIKEGEYEGDKAKAIIDTLRTNLRQHIDACVAEYGLDEAIPTLIANIDGLTNKFERDSAQVENSVDQEVEYEREVSAGEQKQYFLNHHANYKYLIEKFVQLQPKGRRSLTKADLAQLLAHVDILLHLYSASDFLQYGIYTSKIKIDHDYIVEVSHGEDIGKLQTTLVQEQAQVQLGMRGNKNDYASFPLDVNKYVDQLDKAFEKDLGFSFRDVVDTLKTLAMWAGYADSEKERVSYSADLQEITEVLKKGIRDFDHTRTEAVLKYLTLDPNHVLIVSGDKNSALDIPVWEHNKRPYRYSIRPLVRIGDRYFWGAHSAERASRIWLGIAHNQRTPASIGTPSVEKVLEGGHDLMTSELQKVIADIAKRISPEVEVEVYPHKHGLVAEDIGDIDVFVYIRDKNILLNIESKIIDQAYCNKDLKRLSEKIFGRTTSGGSFEDGYLQRVEKRAAFLQKNGKELADKFWKGVAPSPKVISIFATQTAYWWTRYPRIQTDVHFVETTQLEELIRKLISFNTE